MDRAGMSGHTKVRMAPVSGAMYSRLDRQNAQLLEALNAVLAETAWHNIGPDALAKARAAIAAAEGGAE